MDDDLKVRRHIFQHLAFVGADPASDACRRRKGRHRRLHAPPAHAADDPAAACAPAVTFPCRWPQAWPRQSVPRSPPGLLQDRRSAAQAARCRGRVSPTSARSGTAQHRQFGFQLLDMQGLGVNLGIAGFCSVVSRVLLSACNAMANACKAAKSEGREAVESDMFLCSTTPRETPAFSGVLQHFFMPPTDADSPLSQPSAANPFLRSATPVAPGVRRSRSSMIGGQTNRPFSSRLANRHSPEPSQYRTLI